MPIRKSFLGWSLVLRLVMALIFALIALIFSELIPPIGFVSQDVVRLAITIWFGFLGFSIFPDVAKKITYVVISWVNLLTHKVSAEIMDQIQRLPRNQSLSPVPYANQAPVGGVSMNQALIVDTSAIIDGRILDIAKAGFLFGTLLIPQFVLSELQQVADSSDYLKRSRGRRGFEIIEELKKVKGVRIEIWDKEVAAKEVDDKLLRLTKSLNGKIITTDFNLNRVAVVSGINVLNINDLANAVKTVAIPGERLTVKVIHVGKDSKQGIAYLPDGTMIVVEDGGQLIGKEVKTEVTRVLQVSAGKMIFTKHIK